MRAQGQDAQRSRRNGEADHQRGVTRSRWRSRGRDGTRARSGCMDIPLRFVANGTHGGTAWCYMAANGRSERRVEAVDFPETSIPGVVVLRPPLTATSEVSFQGLSTPPWPGKLVLTRLLPPGQHLPVRVGVIRGLHTRIRRGEGEPSDAPREQSSTSWWTCGRVPGLRPVALLTSMGTTRPRCTSRLAAPTDFRRSPTRLTLVPDRSRARPDGEPDHRPR